MTGTMRVGETLAWLGGDAPYFTVHAHNPTNISAPNATLPLLGLEAAPVEDGAALLLVPLIFTGPVTDAKPDGLPPDVADGSESGGTDYALELSGAEGELAGGRAGWSWEPLGEIVKREWEGRDT
ncbi:hypothetical protein C8R45DRAFT_1218381 [Mycena sanguinolenta]|nr:hypothetical protein C8R45DRAFT_1218381 [Mycena sanguinolenta]